jgi:hypothetical protein
MDTEEEEVEENEVFDNDQEEDGDDDDDSGPSPPKRATRSSGAMNDSFVMPTPGQPKRKPKPTRTTSFVVAARLDETRKASVADMFSPDLGSPDDDKNRDPDWSKTPMQKRISNVSHMHKKQLSLVSQDVVSFWRSDERIAQHDNTHDTDALSVRFQCKFTAQ